MAAPRRCENSDPIRLLSWHLPIEMLALLSGALVGWSSLARPQSALRAHRPAMSLTEELMTTLPTASQTGGAGGQSTYEALLRLDSAWAKLRADAASGTITKPPDVVFEEPNAPAEVADYDVIVCGGNIGILLATALVVRGLRVAVLEAGMLRGREQDWNASRKEVEELVEAGVISREEVADIVGIEFNPVRCGFSGGQDVWLQNVLNVGVRPERLIGLARARFEAAGGKVFEGSPLASVAVRPGAAVVTTKGGDALRGRLVVDCMGQRSPIVGQIRGGEPPEGACVVVGSCADGFAPEMNTFGDVIFADGTTEGTGASGCSTQYVPPSATVVAIASATVIAVVSAIVSAIVITVVSALVITVVITVVSAGTFGRPSRRARRRPSARRTSSRTWTSTRRAPPCSTSWTTTGACCPATRA